MSVSVSGTETISTRTPQSVDAGSSEVRFPTETEIYVLPDGTVVIADLPVELASLAAALGTPEPCHIDPSANGSAA